MPTVPRLALLATIGTALAACGGGSSSPPAPDPLAAFKAQDVAWAICDPNVLGPNRELIERLGERVACATVEAPLDYTAPAGLRIKVAMLRVASADPAVRKGSILINPGGPGADGMEMAANLGVIMTQPAQDSPEQAQLNELVRHYDLIGFAPRGLGASTSLGCASNALLRPGTAVLHDRSPANIEAMLYNARLIAEACRANPLTPFINTDQTARDMDLLRHLVGDAKLNYIGYSYGTWLGAWYAALFPQHMGHVVLDSSMNFTSDFDNASATQVMGQQRTFDTVLAPYAARHPDLFGLGSDPDAIRRLFGGFPAPLKAAFASNIALASEDGIVLSTVVLALAQRLNLILAAEPGLDYAQLAERAMQEPIVPSPRLQETAVAQLRPMLNSYFSAISTQPEALSLTGGAAQYHAVVCNDTTSDTRIDHVVARDNQAVHDTPLVAGRAASSPCLFWGGPSVAKPAVEAVAAAGHLMMLQSENDPLTTAEGAQAFFARLPSASLTYVSRSSKHGLFPYQDACVDMPLVRFFVDGTVPPRRTDCVGKALPFDTPTAAQTRGLATQVDDPIIRAARARVADIIAGAGRAPGLGR